MSCPELRPRPGVMHQSIPIWYSALDRIDRKFVIDAFLEGEKAVLASKNIKLDIVHSLSATDRLTQGDPLLPKEIRQPRKQSLSELIREQTLAQHAEYLKEVVRKACENSKKAGHDEKWCCSNPAKDHLLRTCTILNPASRMHCVNCGFPKPVGKNLIYRTLMVWVDWQKEREPSKLKYSAWHKWKRNIKPAKMRFKKGIKKLIMINRFKAKPGSKPLTAIQQYEAKEAAKKAAAQKKIDDQVAKARGARNRLKRLAQKTNGAASLYRGTNLGPELAIRKRRPSEVLNEAILETLRLNEIDEAGAEKRNVQTKDKIAKFQEEQGAVAAERQRLLDMRLNAGQIRAKFNLDNPFGLDRTLMHRTIKRENDRAAGHAEHLREIIKFKQEMAEDSDFDL